MTEPATTNPNGSPREQVTLFDVPLPGPNCGDETPTGQYSTRYDYVLKTINNGGLFYDGCEPWLYGNMQVNNLQINSAVTAATVTATEVTASGITLTSRKAFDIPHPIKEGWRLRHICLEGPESAVYYRGRLTDSNVINLPEYWMGLVNPESITVSLTQIGFSQDLIVEKIEQGNKVFIKSNNASNIDCYFLIHGERTDGEKLIVEYEGQEYPGDNDQYSLNR